LLSICLLDIFVLIIIYIIIIFALLRKINVLNQCVKYFYRLLRTVESLLSMREPDLARMTPVEENGSSPSPTVDHHRHHDTSFSLSNSNFANSTTLQEATASSGCSNSSRGNESSSGHQDDSRSPSLVKTSVIEFTRNLQSFVPSVRRSPDTASWNSSSSKTTEEEDILALAASNGITSNGTPISTLSRTTKRLEKKESMGLVGKPKVKPASSPVSSAEGESGFFSISSFQEVGLPASAALPITPIKGCHTEVGLPEVPLDKTRHRRWSSTPAEIQALFKQHRASIGGMPQTTTESVSVCWVWVCRGCRADYDPTANNRHGFSRISQTRLARITSMIFRNNT